MSGKLGKFQMETMTGWKGLTRRNHLGSVCNLSPQGTGIMVELLAAHRGKNLEQFLRQYPVKTFETGEEYTWDIVGSSRRNITLVEARNELGTTVTASTDNVGVATAPFELVFAEDYFADGEVIFGNLNELYPFRILGDGRMEGTNTVYTVELMGGITTGCPSERLLMGEKFSVGFAPVEQELSREVGDIRFASSSKMRNEFTTIRLKHKIAGNKYNLKLKFGIPVKDAKTGKKMIHSMWMHYVDYKFEEQWQDYKIMAMYLGTSNRTSEGKYLNFGKSGDVIRMGMGLREQLSAGNTMYYNDPNVILTQLENAVYEISYSSIPISERRVYVRTGERGLALISKKIKEEASGWISLSNNNPAVIKSVKSELHQNALSVGAQFVEWQAPNGVILTFDLDPMKDDPVLNKVESPWGGLASSYEFDIYDMGAMDQPNIFLAQIKNQPERRGYQCGFTNAFTGQMDNPNMSFDEDACVVHRIGSFGVCVLDPTRTLSLRPAVLQG